MSQLTVAASPHFRSGNSTAKIMLDVIIALCPALIAGVIVFGWRALLVVAVCILSCIVFEYLSRLVMKRDNTIGDLSAVVTGMLLAFNLPVTIPLWMAVIGCFIAIVIVKQLFGGIGQNFANPAITARIVLMISFTTQMTHWVQPFFYQNSGVDAITTATPLTLITTPDKTALTAGDVSRRQGRMYRRSQRTGFADRWRISDRKTGDQSHDTACIYRNGLCVLRVVWCTAGISITVRRFNAGSYFYGD